MPGGNILGSLIADILSQLVDKTESGKSAGPVDSPDSNVESSADLKSAIEDTKKSIENLNAILDQKMPDSDKTYREYLNDQGIEEL